MLASMLRFCMAISILAAFIGCGGADTPPPVTPPTTPPPVTPSTAVTNSDQVNAQARAALRAKLEGVWVLESIERNGAKTDANSERPISFISEIHVMWLISEFAFGAYERGKAPEKMLSGNPIFTGSLELMPAADQNLCILKLDRFLYAPAKENEPIWTIAALYRADERRLSACVLCDSDGNPKMEQLRENEKPTPPTQFTTTGREYTLIYTFRRKS